MADVQTVTVTLSDGTPVQVVAGTPLHELYLALAGFTTTASGGLADIDLTTLRTMAWFMTPHGPQSVIEPATIAEFRRRDYAEITAQQAADFFANAIEIPDVSFITGQELPGAMAAAVTDDDSPFAVAARAALVPRPAGGTDGQALVKNGTDVAWGPAGLTAQQIAADPTVRAGFERLAWGRTFVLLGNSRIALETNTAGVPSRQQRGVFTWANMRLGNRCQILNYAGVSGDRLAQMIARYSTAVAAYAPDVVVIADAVNDISAGATLAEIQGWYGQLMALNRGIGARTVLLTVNPSSGHTASVKAVLGATNRWLKSLTDLDVLVIDVTACIAADTGMDWAAGMATDGLHQSRRGAARMGRVVANALDPLVPHWDVLPATAGDAGNGVPNPFMSGAVGNNVPTGWTVFPAQGVGVTYSLVARTDQRPGNWFQADTTAAAADVFMASQAALAGVAATGDYVEAVVEVESDAWAAVAGQVRLTLRLLDASNAVVASASDGLYVSTTQVGDTGDATAFPLENQPGLGSPVVFRTLRVQVPATATQVKVEFEFNGQGKVRLGRASARKAL